jgi:PAS domain-containing protein
LDYALIPPYQSLRIAAPYDLFQWTLLIANGALISVLKGLRHARHESEQRRLRQAETMGQLRESETRFRQLAEHTRDIFWVHDWPDGRVSYVSPAFEAMTGIPAGDLYRDVRVWSNAIHPEDREQPGKSGTRAI